MTRDDTHDRCLVCLGEDHDMARCNCFRQLQLRTRVERARAMLLWRKRVTAWPLSRRAYEEKRKAGDFEGLEYLSEEYIHRFLGVTGPRDLPVHRHFRLRDRLPYGLRPVHGPHLHSARSQNMIY